MSSATQDTFRFVEPGAIPAGVRFYSAHRAIAAMQPPRAFFVGIVAGVLGTSAAGLLVFIVSIL